MATNIAEVLRLAARPTPYDNDERTWLEFRFKLENHLTPVNERYIQLLQDAESQPVDGARGQTSIAPGHPRVDDLRGGGWRTTCTPGTNRRRT